MAPIAMMLKDMIVFRFLEQSQTEPKSYPHPADSVVGFRLARLLFLQFAVSLNLIFQFTTLTLFHFLFFSATMQPFQLVFRSDTYENPVEVGDRGLKLMFTMSSMNC